MRLMVVDVVVGEELRANNKFDAKCAKLDERLPGYPGALSGGETKSAEKNALSFCDKRRFKDGGGERGGGSGEREGKRERDVRRRICEVTQASLV